MLGWLEAAVTPDALVTVDLVQPTKAFQKPRESQVDLAASGEVSPFNFRKKLVELSGSQEPVEFLEGGLPILLRYDEMPCERGKMRRTVELCPNLPSCLPRVLLEGVILYTR